MRILQVSSASALGGGEVHVIELTEALRQRHHEVSIIGRREGPLQAEFHLPFRNSADLYSSYRLRRIIRINRFDVVHAHVARDYPVVAAALLGLDSPRFVCTRQLIFPVKRNPLYSRINGWTVTTDQILDSIQHLKPRASLVVPNWVDSNKFQYDERSLQTPIVVGLLGQVSPHKGHDDAIEAVRMLGSKYKLLIGGSGDSAYLATLKQQAEGLPIEFLGFVKPTDFMKIIDILIVPSWEEPFGIVILEAMAAGINVIATDAGGPPEILDWGNAGILIAPRTPSELSSAITRLADSQILRENLRKHAIDRVRSRYDITLTVPKIENFYTELLSE